MKRWAYFVYGVCCYLGFMAIYAYMAGFVGDFFVPKSIDTAPESSRAAWAIDFVLIVFFGLQHSIMARPGFKKIWMRLIPQPIERSTYVLISCVAVALLMWQWRGLDGIVWDVTHPAGRILLWGLFAAGWLMVPAVSLMINHFDLFGLRQVWLYMQGRPYTALPFRTPLFYDRMRHPLYMGWALAFWAIPTMTVGHFFFAGTLTLYMAGAAFIEERDLVSFFGDEYRAYRRRVPMFLPGLGIGSKSLPADSVVSD